MLSGNTFQILLVEDNPDHAEIILRRIRRAAGGRLQPTHAATLAAGMAALTEKNFDAVLLDLHLPDSRGLNTLDEMVRQAAWLPVIVLTSLGDEEIATASVQQGAQDFLVKDDFTSELLIRAIRYAIERKRIEERLKSSMADLAVHAQELEQLNRKLEDQNTDLNHFNHMISHDLREPIRHLLLFSRRLQKSGVDDVSDSSRHDLKLIYAAATRMERSIAGLQKLSEASRQQIHRPQVSAAACLQAALDDLVEPIAECGAVITSDPLPEIEADASLVTLLYRNLVANALRYRAAKPLIHATIEQESGQHIFGVRDNGIGIDPQYAGRIFEPFQRLHGREEYGGGSGLGLAICKKVVSGHGGSIWVEANPSGGSHFRFTLGPHAVSEPEQEVLVHGAEMK